MQSVFETIRLVLDQLHVISSTDQEIKAVASIEEYNNAERLDTDNKERFSDYLIRKGVLSPKMLHRLQIEFLEGPSSDGSFSSNNSNSNVTSQRKSKKRSKTRK